MTGSSPSRPVFDGREADHRDHPTGLRGVVGELRMGRDVLIPQAIAIRPLRDRCRRLERPAVAYDL